MLAMANFLPFEKPPGGDKSGKMIRYFINFVKMHFAVLFCGKKAWYTEWNTRRR